MNINGLKTPVLSSVEEIEQLEQFLTGSQAIAFLVASSKEVCFQGELLFQDDLFS